MNAECCFAFKSKLATRLIRVGVIIRNHMPADQMKLKLHTRHFTAVRNHPVLHIIGIING